jgi:phosphatidylglycerol:prolipoprotein diacylglycerol transferase
VSLTTRVFDINPGEWTVSADMVRPHTAAGLSRHSKTAAASAPRVHRAAWSWPRWRLSPAPPKPLKTRFAPLTGFASMPAVIPGSWFVLVALGVVLGFIFQGRLLPREHVDPSTVFRVSLITVGAGVLGAKLWFIGLQRSLRGVWRDGMCIQGALVGAAVVMLAALALLRLPIGAVLDATTPGLFVGMAVGRVGCFLTGCCAGRRTASRWAPWSSDRRVGARRVPTQLLESSAALVIGLSGLLVISRITTATTGTLFVASFAAYTLVRQFLLRLRAEGRRTSRGGLITALLAAVVLVAAVASLVITTR